MIDDLLSDSNFTIDQLLKIELSEVRLGLNCGGRAQLNMLDSCDQISKRLLELHSLDQNVIANPHDRLLKNRELAIYPLADHILERWIDNSCSCTREEEWAIAFISAHSCRDTLQAGYRLELLRNLVFQGVLAPWLYARVVDDSNLSRGGSTIYGTLLPGHMHPGLLYNSEVEINENRQKLGLPELKYEHSHVYIYPWYYK